MLALAASSDGRLLASAGADKLVHVWDVREGRHVQARRAGTRSLT